VKILMVSSEAVPFAKAGGLGDAVTALSLALSRAGHDVRIVIPRYYCVDRSALEQVGGPLGIPVGNGEEFAGVYRAFLPGSKLQVYFLDHERFFGRDGIYGTKSEPDFADNPQRFAFLSRGAFQLCRALGWIPDVVHAHDWPAALAPVYLRHLERLSEFAKTASVLTIHNLGYQGVYGKDAFSFFRLPWSLFHGAGFEYYDRVNLLKAGLYSADCLTAVSPTYAREIQTPEYGFGLDGLLRFRSSDLVGILNGADLEAWDPETDPLLPATYSAKDLRGKAACKAALQR
jgi:starch synthase